MIAGESSRAYKEIVTINLVSIVVPSCQWSWKANKERVVVTGVPTHVSYNYLVCNRRSLFLACVSKVTHRHYFSLIFFHLSVTFQCIGLFKRMTYQSFGTVLLIPVLKLQMFGYRIYKVYMYFAVYTVLYFAHSKTWYFHQMFSQLAISVKSIVTYRGMNSTCLYVSPDMERERRFHWHCVNISGNLQSYRYRCLPGETGPEDYTGGELTYHPHRGWGPQQGNNDVLALYVA